MPIRTMFEFIRKKTMNMLGMKGTLCEKLINSFSSTRNENFQINKGIAMGCQVLFRNPCQCNFSTCGCGRYCITSRCSHRHSLVLFLHWTRF